MNRRPRRNHSAAFKAKVALAQLRGFSRLRGPKWLKFHEPVFLRLHYTAAAGTAAAAAIFGSGCAGSSSGNGMSSSCSSGWA